MQLLLSVLVLFPLFTAGVDAEAFVCREAGQCRNGFEVGFDRDVESYDDCLAVCKANSQCLWFTHVGGVSICLSFATCPSITEGQCPECLSGKFYRDFSLSSFFFNEGRKKEGNY